MKFEFSAGGVVKKTEGTHIKILLCQHSQHHGWVFPKGLIDNKVEKGELKVESSTRKETKEEAALREVEEETGIKATIIRPLKQVTYWYVWSGFAREKEKRKKTVYYFVMEFVEDTKKRDNEMEAVEWLPIEDVDKRLTYPSDKKVWEEAKKSIK